MRRNRRSVYQRLNLRLTLVEMVSIRLMGDRESGLLFRLRSFVLEFLSFNDRYSVTTNANKNK